MSIQVFLNDQELQVLNYKKQGSLTDVSTITIPNEIPAGSYELRVIALDEKWFSDTKTVDLEVIDDDLVPPYLMKDRIQVLRKEGGYSVALLFADDASTITQWTIEQNSQLIYEFKGNVATFDLSDLTQPITYSVIDAAGNKLGGNLDLKKYE